MSETILVALITMAAGVFGAGTGAIVSLVINSRELKKHVLEKKRTCYAQLISEYNTLYSEVAANPDLIDGLPSEKEQQLFTQFQIAHANALLICNKSSVEPIAAFLNQVISLHLRRFTPEGIHAAYVSVLTVMRKELVH